MLHLSKMGLNQVFHELSGCRTAEALIDAAGKHMKNPLILADISLHILALTPDDDIPDPRWHDLFAERTMPENLVNMSLYRDALRTESPVLSTDSTGLPIVRCAVAQDGKLIRYLDSVALRHLLESIFLKKGVAGLSFGKNHSRRKEEK